jgi:hypothetical protein
MTPLDHFLRACADEIGRRASADDGRRATLEAGARAFRDAVRNAAPRDHELSDVPVTACLDHLTAGPLVPLLLSARPEISWIATPRTSDGGIDLALAPLNDVRHLGDVTCGLILLGPGCSYPEHAHPPHEIYLPIAGAGRWRYGSDPSYRELGSAALVYNQPHNVHAIQAQTDPLLALYVLWH